MSNEQKEMNDDDYKLPFVIRALGFLITCEFLQVILLLDGSVNYGSIPRTPQTVKALHLHSTEYLHYVLEIKCLEKTNSEGIVTK